MRSIRFGKAGITGVAVVVVLGLVMLIVPSLAAGDIDHLTIQQFDQICTMLNADGTQTIPVLASKIKTIETSSINGNIIYKCTSEKGAITNDTGSAIQHKSENFPGVFCEIPVSGGTEITNDWHQDISSNGNATLTCKL